eukprot:CAMPEP_0114617042 /NCGR_PEP_ID=MMETSP0168-20121206/6994_1 /TAXON_ID=95228 ORGANISM="Vannella sp., Strain DIVA3 517/6/12" /NCGR_SAMPLE_ID=MMETSP0168 /ASSEMBLY_ACC=CAM_ASM_000044 /LENGTH=205 /DNA_ID=CAMNT_0001828167 /DNA_START=142 /DNA_END=756 /DNA_ORIENTATION=-
MREIKAETGVLSRADGSCRFAQGETEVLVGVTGPLEAGSREEEHDKAVIVVSFEPRAGHSTVNERRLEEVVRGTFEQVVLRTLYPRTVVTVVVQEVSSDGALLSAAINAVSLALVDAGIPMRGLVSSCTVSVGGGEEEKGSGERVDGSAEEESASRAKFTFAYNAPAASPSAAPEKASPEGIVTSVASGAFSQKEYWRAEAAAAA